MFLREKIFFYADKLEVTLVSYSKSVMTEECGKGNVCRYSSS